MIDKLLNKLANQEKSFLSKEIFAPYIRGGSQIRVKLNGVIYKLETPKLEKDGFGVFQAVDANSALLERDAESFEIAEYLEMLPKLDVILISKVGGRWLVYPFNKQSFEQKFKVNAKPFHILVADGVENLDTATVRFDGAHFWFDSIKFNENMDKMVQLRDRIQEGNYALPKNQKLTPEEATAFRLAASFHKQANMSNLERRLQAEMGRYDAQVEKFVERGDNVEVQWKDNWNGGKYTSVFKIDDLSVVTAGICLSGGDKKFDLQSLVGVIRQGENRYGVNHVGRGGMEERRYWEMYGDRTNDNYEDDDDYDDYY